MPSSRKKSSSREQTPRDPSDNDVTISSPFLPDKRCLRDDDDDYYYHYRHRSKSTRRNANAVNKEMKKGGSLPPRDPSELEEDSSVDSGEYDDFIGQNNNNRAAAASDNANTDNMSSSSDDEAGYNKRRANKIDNAALLTSEDDRRHTNNKAHPELLRGYKDDRYNSKNNGRGKSNSKNRYNNSSDDGYNHEQSSTSYRNTTSSKMAKRSKNKWYANKTNYNYGSESNNNSRHQQRWNGGNNNSTADYNYHTATTGVKYRSASSTQRALEELKRKKLEAKEKKRAFGILTFMIVMAGGVHYIGSGGNVVASGSSGSSVKAGTIGDSAAVDRVYGKLKGSDNVNDRMIPSSGNNSYQSVKILKSNEEGGIINTDINNNDNTVSSANVVVDSSILQEETPPKEKIYDESHQFLTPLHHFADVRDPPRQTDTAFFFHVPRSGGSTVKDMLGKCMRLVQSSEVGVRDGHDRDTTLQVLTVQENKYVNVDTTTIPGIQRAVDLGLAQSGMSDLIVSSYFHDSAALFDLQHQGRAFVMLRNPIDRAVSMYYHRLHELHDLEESVTIEDYAQGNGIENNWMTRFLTNRMTGELTKEDLEHAKVIMREKFLIGFLDDLEESIYRIIKYNGWRYDDDETAKMKQEDCIADLTKLGSNINAEGYEIPKRGSQGYALIIWQTQFDSKLFDYARELFDGQTKLYGTKERKKQRKKDKQKKKGG